MFALRLSGSKLKNLQSWAKRDYFLHKKHLNSDLRLVYTTYCTIFAELGCFYRKPEQLSLRGRFENCKKNTLEKRSIELFIWIIRAKTTSNASLCSLLCQRGYIWRKLDYDREIGGIRNRKFTWRHGVLGRTSNNWIHDKTFRTPKELYFDLNHLF